MNPKYKQLENEDNYEYGLRLIEIKVEQNPSDLEWSDIVDLLGLDVHYDSLRLPIHSNSPLHAKRQFQRCDPDIH